MANPYCRAAQVNAKMNSLKVINAKIPRNSECRNPLASLRSVDSLAYFEMVFSLFQPSSNLTGGLSSYPAPTAPDTFYCNYWYAEPDPPDPADCQVALDLLPGGTDDEPFSYHSSNNDPNRLPLN